MASKNPVVYLRVNHDLDDRLRKAHEVENHKREGLGQKPVSLNKFIESVLNGYLYGANGSMIMDYWWEEIGKARKEQAIKEKEKEAKLNGVELEDWV